MKTETGVYLMWSLDQILGGCIAVIVAAMPAFIALLKIKD